MKRGLMYAGWIIAVIAIVAAAYGWRLSARLAVEADDMKQDIERLAKLAPSRRLQ